MNLMRPRVSEVYYPEAMRHIIRKRTVTKKTPSQNNGDILMRSAGCSIFLFSFRVEEGGGIVPCSLFYNYKWILFSLVLRPLSLCLLLSSSCTWYACDSLFLCTTMSFLFVIVIQNLNSCYFKNMTLL